MVSDSMFRSHVSIVLSILAMLAISSLSGCVPEPVREPTVVAPAGSVSITVGQEPAAKEESPGAASPTY